LASPRHGQAVMLCQRRPSTCRKCCVKRTGHTVDPGGRNSQRGGIRSSACRPRRPHPRSASL